MSGLLGVKPWRRGNADSWPDGWNHRAWAEQPDLALSIGRSAAGRHGGLPPGPSPASTVASPQNPAALQPWLTELGLDPGAGLPVHIFLDSKGLVDCVRAASIAAKATATWSCDSWSEPQRGARSETRITRRQKGPAPTSRRGPRVLLPSCQLRLPVQRDAVESHVAVIRGEGQTGYRLSRSHV